MFPAVVTLVAVLGAAVVTNSQTSHVRLQASQSTVEEGGRFSIDVYAYAHKPVNAVDITIQFDDDSVRVLEVDRGQSVLTIWTEDPIIEDDRVILRGGTFRKGFLGEHKVATLDLQARSVGQKNFSISDAVMLAGDGSGTPVAVSEVNDSALNLYIYDANADPESIGVAVAVSIVTDINGDGKVTLTDISTFMSAWHNNSVAYDFNGDGRMTFRDFSILLADFFFE